MLNFRTPEDFIKYYANKLNEYAQSNGIQITKTGFIGYLLSVLGWTNYDLKNYYDSLFNEMFIATAVDYNSLITHGVVHGYFPSFATPASVDCQLVIDPVLLPKAPYNQRLEFVHNEDSNLNLKWLTFYLGEIPFTFEGDLIIDFYEQSSTHIAVATVSSNKDRRVIPFSDLNNQLIIPLIDVKQYAVQVFEYHLKDYLMYSSDTITLVLEPEQHIYSIDAYVRERNATEWKKYKIEPVKYLSSSSDEVLFIRKAPIGNSYIIESGDGKHGKFIPMADVKLVVKTTKGDSANNITNVQTTNVLPAKMLFTSSLPTDSNPTSTPMTTTVAFSDIGHLSILKTYGGKNALTQEELRADIIKFIQSRKTLVTKYDFYNIASRYLDDFEFLFKKGSIQDHTFYLYKAFRDKYQQIVKSTNVSLPKATIEANPYKPTTTIDGDEYISPFMYKYDEKTNLYTACIVQDNLTVNFERLIPKVGEALKVKSALLNITYDSTNNETKFSVTSFEDLSPYTAKITIPQAGIIKQQMTFNSNSFSYTISDIIVGSFDCTIELYDSPNNLVETLIAKDLVQAYDCTNIVDLQQYNGNLIAIPVISKAKYEENPPESTRYYDNFLIDFIINTNITEDRVISDNIQTRFLNTINVPSPYAQVFNKQESSVLINYSIKGFTTLVPSSPSPGDSYYVLPGARDLFASHENTIATYTPVGTWEFERVSIADYGPVVYQSTPPTTPDPDTTYVVKPPGTGDWNGHDNQIAKWDSSSSTWTFTIPTYPSVIYDVNTNQYYYYIRTWNSSASIFEYEWKIINIQLPLKLYVNIVFDKNIVRQKQINTSERIDLMKLFIAQNLNDNYTGTKIKYYDSQLIEFIHDTFPEVKSVQVVAYDSANNLIFHGIETVDDLDEAMYKLSKQQIVDYTPSLWYWDLDNIQIQHSLN